MIQKFIQKTILVVCLFGNYSVVTMAQESRFGKKFHEESAKAVIAIGDSISKGETISKEEWNELFEINGYEHYLNHRNKERVSTYIQEALLLAFDSQKTTEMDSLLELSAEEADIGLVLKQNICRLARQRTKAAIFLKETDFSKLQERADKKAQTFLSPAGNMEKDRIE